ncbi:PaaI family thioesterase [Bermanella sp. R86510]|uniref:PaaI family thioesterase n=1 Tax=unclassified Bermanella TaxID=2627862 RepID=UPI0037CBAA58
MSDTNPYLGRAERFISVLKHCQVLGMKVVEASNKSLTIELPYSEQHVGNPSTGVIHGGVLTTLMDTACGTMVINALPEFELCPTLDLRVDYVRAAEPGESIFAFAEAYRVSRNVVFTRCTVHQGDVNEPVANCVATFMRIGSHMTPPDFQKVVVAEDYYPGVEGKE